MTQKKLSLEVITQEKKLLETPADQLTVMTSVGEVTILPGHISLLSRLDPGILRYKIDNKEQYVVIYGGFMDVSSAGRVSILADAAKRAEDLDLKKLEEARVAAEKVLQGKFVAPEDFERAETALRLAHLDLKVARLHRTGTRVRAI